MLREWEKLPKFMQTEEVRPYYDSLKKKKISLALKRGFDVFAASVMLVTFSPVLITISIMIVRDSKGGVFYRQERVTQYGRKFKIFKFRTMVANADKIGTQVTVSNDSTAVYDAIKDFVEQYNSALSEMNKYYYADSARGYDPLTDDQKEAMSDEEVEKWETKIKDSLLRRDSTLSGILETFRTSLTGITVKASDGKTYSLANLGITTGKDYKEYGLLHIKGDEDDTDYADSENTLQSMINSDPDIVMEVMSGIASNLYNNINKKISTTTTMKSALSFYNDKEMTKQMTQYKKDIKSWETKLSDMEDRYYKQFSAMETALSKLQSQQNSLASYLGSN